tara:strand:+ start:3252 stop:3791 length:540 start_codon:yes stop_codon:yes gene_type:complete
MLIKESQLRAIIREELLKDMDKKIISEGFMQDFAKEYGRLGLKGAIAVSLFSMAAACNKLDIDTNSMDNPAAAEKTVETMTRHNWNKAELKETIKGAEDLLKELKGDKKPSEVKQAIIKSIETHLAVINESLKNLDDFKVIGKKDAKALKAIEGAMELYRSELRPNIDLGGPEPIGEFP